MNGRTRLVCVSVVLLAACGRPASRSQPVGRDSAERPVTGTVETVGVSPATSVVVRTSEGGAVRVEGPLASELGHLVGASVTIYGVKDTTTGPMNSLVVTRYDVLQVDGEVPFVGVVRVSEGTVWLEAQRRLLLRGATSMLGQLDGAKVYVLGEASGDTVVVVGVGVIRPAR